MSDVKFSALPAATTVALTDIVPEVDLTAGTTKKATWATVRVALFPASLTADVSGTLPVANGGTGTTTLPGGGFAGLTAMNAGDAASVTTAGTNAATAITAERTSTATLTGKTIAGASNTLTIRIASDVTGLGTGVATFLGTPSGANLGTALTSALPVAKGGTGLTALTIPASGLLVGTTDTQTLTNKTIAAGSNTITGLTPANDVAASAMAALAIDWSVAAVFTKTLAAGANTITFSNQSSGRVIMVRLTGAASTVTWPTVKWAGGTAPTQTTSGTDVYTFMHDGTSVYGSVVQAMA